jgi:DNA-binding XRE family transcriptional regulator
MSLQTIQINGREFVLIPAICYKHHKIEIDNLLAAPHSEDEYVPLVPEDYFKNPIALERIKRRVTQKQLAKLLGCSQSYISQLESSTNVSAQSISRVKKALKTYPDRWENRE